MSPSEWARLLPLAKEAMGPEVYAAAVAEGKLDGPGLLPASAQAAAPAAPSVPAPAPAPAPAPPAPAAPPAAAAVEYKPPMVPAVMRNAHEVLRGDIKLASAALEAGDLAAFKQHWAALHRFLVVHMAMEDAGMFPLLDATFDGAISKAALGAEHEHDTADGARVEAAGECGSTLCARDSCRTELATPLFEQSPRETSPS